MNNNINTFEILNTINWAYTKQLISFTDVARMLIELGIDPDKSVINDSYYEFVSLDGKTKYEKHYN